LDLIARLKLSPDEYVFLYCHYHKIKLPQIRLSLVDLENRGLIKILERDEIALRDSALAMFEHKDEDKLWIEFFTTFPMKVPGRNGVNRPLRPANLDAKSALPTKKKYLAMIKNNPELHKSIIKILNAEIAMRKQAGELQYMHNIDTWLNQRDYEKYSYLIEEKNERDKERTGYGQTLI